MQNKLEAKAVSNEMQGVGRHGGDGLRGIAKNLYNATTSKDAKDILIGGWHLDEELHGGYENSSGSREVLGKGIHLYSDTVSSKRTDHSYSSTTESVIVQAWKQEKKVIFIALRVREESGYAGIDNHHGTDTHWEVIALRIVDL